MRVKIDTHEIRTKLIGEYNVYNILAAYKTALFFKIARDKIKAGIEKAFVPGRLQRVETKNGVHVFIDFAHTPDAFKKTLELLKPLSQGKLIVVFGCPGDRDRDKRPIMGKIASELADIVIVTTDDPHSEDPDKIIDEVMQGSSGAMRIADRTHAIVGAISMAQKNDIVLIAGRGHEKYQDYNGKRVLLDDLEIVKRLD